MYIVCSYFEEIKVAKVYVTISKGVVGGFEFIVL